MREGGVPTDATQTVIDTDPAETYRSRGTDDGLRESGDEAIRLAPGEEVGRYVVLELLGAGAVGVVYAAYDPELDRKIALKLLQPRGGGGKDDSSRRTRLLREAQALARLSHPNVVSVHDVGTYRGRVYVGMEFIDGSTLRAWMEGERRELGEVLEVFCRAGEGLAAAHAAGLVHRDFKPDNVIIGLDGRVKVLDFGLARAADAEGAKTDRMAALESSGHASLTATGALSIDLTRTGGVMGTPAYMSAEQHLGLEVDARTDQFSFCVALYEALYRRRPFRGDTVPELAIEVTGGEVRPPPEGSTVPAAVHRVLVRGLSADPIERWPDMSTLLAALRSAVAPRRRTWWWWSAAAAAAAVALAFVPGEPRASEDPCAGGEARVLELWGPDRAQRVQSAFAATRLPYAEHAAATAVGSIDAWTGAWAASHRDSCEATRVRREQSDTLMDRRMHCLNRAYAEVDALVRQLESADADVVEHAIEATGDLPSLATCADAERLLATAVPLEGERKAQAQALAVELDEVRAMLRVAEHGAGLERALGIEAEVTALGDAATTLRYANTLAVLYAATGDTDTELKWLREAHLAADRAGDDWARAEVATELAQTLGYGLARYEEAERWIARAQATVKRLGDPEPLAANVEVARGAVEIKRGDFDEAITSLTGAIERLGDVEDGRADREVAVQRLAVALRNKGDLDEAARLLQRAYEDVLERNGPDHPATAAALGSLATTAYTQGDYEKAMEQMERSMAILERVFGRDNPRYADRLNNYAAMLWAVGRMDDAEAIHREVLARNEERYGNADVRLTPTLENLGTVLIAKNEFEEARALLERSLAIKREVHGSEHPSTAMSEMNLGVALFQMGELDEADRLYRHTLEVWTEKLGPSHSDLGLVYSNMGDTAEARGRFRDAAEYQLRALALFEPVLGKEHADLGFPLTGLGLARLGMGDPAGAIEALERATKVREGVDLPEGERGRMEFALARALEADDPDRARALARSALTDAETAPGPLAEQIRRWSSER